MSEKNKTNIRTTGRIDRRSMLKMAAGTGTAAMALGSCVLVDEHAKQGATKGNINHSVAYWCFAEYWDIDKTCQITKQLGGKSVELVGPKDFATLKKHGLTCALSPNGTPDPPNTISQALSLLPVSARTSPTMSAPETVSTALRK